MSFRLKIIIGIALIEGLLLTTLVIMSMGIFSDTLDEELSKRGRATAKVFAATTLDHVISSDLGGLESFGDAVMSTPGMVYIRVLDDQGNVMVAKGDVGALNRSFHEDSSLEAAEDDGVYDTFSNVSQDGVVFGRIEIGLEIKALHDVLAKSRNRATGIALVEIFLVALFSYALGTYLSHQIQELKDGVKKLEEGDLGYLVQAKSKDEFGQLAHSFNKLSTKLRSAQLDQNRQSHYLKEIIQNIYDGVMIISSKGIIEKVNPAVSRIFGYGESTLLGNNISFMLPAGKHKDNHDSYLTMATSDDFDLKTIVERKRDFSVQKEDGSFVDVAISISRMHDSLDEVHFVAIINDVTERKLAEAALQSALSKEQEVNRSKTEFFAKVSHELRTPMNGVLGMLHILRKTALKKNQQHYVESAKSSGELMVSIVNDILDFSKLDADKLILEEEPFNPATLIEETITLLAKEAFAKGLDLYCTPALDLPKIVYGDSVRIRQILMNLLNNAIKFTKSGRIHLRARWNEDYLLFSVKDTGLGMTEEQQEKVFKPFEQADNTTTRNFGGTGLGLTITKELVTRMHGTIEVFSEIDVGTQFVCRLPLKADFDNATKSLPVNESWAGREILLVSNDEIFKNHINEILSQNITRHMTSACALIEATAIVETWECKSSPPYNLVIVDIDGQNTDDLTNITSLKFFQKIKHLPVMAISKHNRPDIVKYTTASMSKPVCASKLFEAIQCLIAGEKIDTLTPADNEGEKSDRWFGERKVLLVDDNAVNQEVGFELLKSVGFDVDICDDGKEAVAAVQNTEYEAVLMDVQMPVMDGLEATRAIRALGGDYLSLPIIAITADASKHAKSETKNSGMDEHIEKPFEPETLYRTLARWVPHDHINSGDANPGNADADIQENTNSIPIIDGIDTEGGLARLNGNAKVYRRILNSFRQEQGNVINEIETCLQIGDSIKAASLAHTLKGSGGNIGAEAIYDAAASLEKSCLLGTLNGAKEALEELRKPLEAVMAGLAILSDAPKEINGITSELPVADYQEITKIIERVIQCFDSDFSEARDLWESIQPQLTDTLYHTEAENLDSLINAFELGEAKTVATKMHQQLLENA